MRANSAGIRTNDTATSVYNTLCRAPRTSLFAGYIQP